MRNFQQRMDEIHSRSKARIARRRKALTACVPLVLCLVVTGFCFITYGGAESTVQTYSNKTGSVITVLDGSGRVFTSAEMEAFLADLKPADPTRVQTITVGATAANDAAGTVQAMVGCLTFQIVDAEGSMLHYRLTDQSLSCDETGAYFHLTSAQYEKLLQLLGILEP